ncbi:MAG: class I SAM-dependent methyltransferase [Verrucomicrobia bacterium]|nr:class I SAM-dependent methyltransferase [Verrucomicrobiota bacterium]
MKTNINIGRRQFLHHTSCGLGMAALAPSLGRLSALAAEGTAQGVFRDRAALERLITQMEADGPLYLSIPRPDGHFLSLLVRASQAKRVLEIGTSHGYTAIWISTGLEETGGQLTTLEILSDRVEMARKHVGLAGLAHRVTFQEGDAHQFVATLDGPFDFVFLNADKGGGVDYFQKLFPKKLSPGALLVAYGAIKSKEKMKDYLDLVTNHAAWETVVLSCTMDDGFAVSGRRRT